MYKTIFLGFICFSFQMSLAAPATEGALLGFVDMQTALQNTTAGQAAKKNLTQQFKKSHDDLQKREKQIGKETRQFQKTMSLLSAKRKQERQIELQEKWMAFQKDLEDNQRQFLKKQKDITEPIIRDLKLIVSEIAKERGYAMVVEKMESRVLWAQADLDITNETVNRYNKNRR